MASWLTHLRVAEKACQKLIINDAPLFFVGSIAPDNGFDADISHWCVNRDKVSCNIQRFYRAYIQNNGTRKDIDFYLGYYVHLCTDVVWQKQMIVPRIGRNEDLKRVKQRWRDADTVFLSENPDWYPLVLLRDAENLEKKWLEYDDVLTVKQMRDYVIGLSRGRSAVMYDLNAQGEINQFITVCADNITNGVPGL